MIRFKDVCFDYGDKMVLKDCNMVFDANKITVILGSSGSGKTTILNLLSGQLKAKSGEISGVTDKISYVYQQPRLMASNTVFKNIEYVLLSQYPKDERKAKIENILRLVELTESADKYPYELSGGMAQRVSLARAFVYPSELILMDEPFVGLDITLKRKLFSTLMDLNTASPRTTALVTHSIDEALMLADNVYVFEKATGKVSPRIELVTPQKERSLKSEESTSCRNQIFTILGA